MDITPALSSDRLVIRSYGGDGFNINERYVAGSILLFPTHVESWPVTGLDDLNSDVFAPVVVERPAIEILLVGCGKFWKGLDSK